MSNPAPLPTKTSRAPDGVIFMHRAALGTTYVLGPMTGKVKWNFPAFDEMSDRLSDEGFVAINPAQLDRENGIDPEKLPADFDWKNPMPSQAVSFLDVVKRDISAILTCDSYVALPGWENSTGAKAEKGVLDWMKAKRLDPDKGFAAWTEQTQTIGVNPKDLVGQKKPDISLVPPALFLWVSKCMEDGAKKYTPYNWRDPQKKVRASCYVSAMLRHVLAFMDGEDNASDSGHPHLAHIASSCGILLDARACGTLIDDRPPKGPASQIIEQLTTK